MPPQLVSAKLQFTPALPPALCTVLEGVQTWMAGSIKFTLEYAEPFWRENGYSGMLYSHSGIVAEMYDHTNMEQTKFGFTGFLNGGAAAYSEEVRRDLVLQQLTELLGEEAAHPTFYIDKIWKNEFLQEAAPIRTMAIRPCNRHIWTESFSSAAARPQRVTAAIWKGR